MKYISSCCLAEVDCRNNDGDYCTECNTECDVIEEPKDRNFRSWLSERDNIKHEEGWYDHKEKAVESIKEGLLKYCDPKPEYSGMLAADLAKKLLDKDYLTLKEREEKIKDRIEGMTLPDYIDPKKVMESFDKIISNLKN